MSTRVQRVARGLRFTNSPNRRKSPAGYLATTELWRSGIEKTRSVVGELELPARVDDLRHANVRLSHEDLSKIPATARV